MCRPFLILLILISAELIVAHYPTVNHRTSPTAEQWESGLYRDGTEEIVEWLRQKDPSLYRINKTYYSVCQTDALVQGYNGMGCYSSTNSAQLMGFARRYGYSASGNWIGFSAYDDDMLSRCGALLSLAPSVDFQFDIMPDGTLGDVFGLSLSFNETKPCEARVCMESGFGARIGRTLQEWELADERWGLIAGAAFARHVPFDREDGSQGRFALCCMLNYAKVKFAGAVAQPAKFYLMMTAGEVQA
jgi:hypothetical protein